MMGDMMQPSSSLGSAFGNTQQAFTLNEVSELDSERFQQLWMQLPVGCGGQPL